jgi:hypothetical protein
MSCEVTRFIHHLVGVTGETELPGLTDEEKPRLRGPKRASNIRKLFNLTKDDDVRKYVNTYRKVRRTDDHVIKYAWRCQLS